jgi:hypothetical protein
MIVSNARETFHTPTILRMHALQRVRLGRPLTQQPKIARRVALSIMALPHLQIMKRINVLPHVPQEKLR